MPVLEYQPLKALSLRVQNQEISFFEWVTLLTLCLTPLVAHVLVGVPSPTILDDNRPAWYHRICHYNPTSILWRYAMIADRRIRAQDWSQADLAATSALFWINGQWDGSEDMTKGTHQHCVHLPEGTQASLFSREMVKTLIVTFQGLQAITLLSGGLTEGAIGFTKWMAVDIIFFPIALIGLLRLFCCFWLTEDFSYPPPTDKISCSCRQPDNSSQSFERFSEEDQSYTWYQLYTGFIISFAIVAIVISCVETRKSPCGKFTSGYGHDADVRACLGSVADAIPVSDGIGEPFFGLAAYGHTKMDNGSFVKVDDRRQVANFTGMCLGKLEL